MKGQTVILRGGAQRVLAKDIIDRAPVDAIVNVREMKRSDDQNAKMWAMLSDISRQIQHNGQFHSPEVWKALFMHACAHEVRFVMGLNGEPFPVGFRSSRLTVQQMADLITFIYQHGDENGVDWSDEVRL